jgi:xanthine dehydrogenase small subunit
MVEHHGSQCGFCTPGFIVSMATAHLNGRTDHDDQLAGNLCRCTGYAPILRAAEAAAHAPVPDWMKAMPRRTPIALDPEILSMGRPAGTRAPPMPTSADALADWYEATPTQP